MLVTDNEKRLILRLRQLRKRHQAAMAVVEVVDGECKRWYISGKRERSKGWEKLPLRLEQLRRQRAPFVVVVEMNDGDCTGWYVTESRENIIPGLNEIGILYDSESELE